MLCNKMEREIEYEIPFYSYAIEDFLINDKDSESGFRK